VHKPRWKRRRGLVSAGAAVLSALLVAVLLASRSDQQDQVRAAPPAPNVSAEAFPWAGLDQPWFPTPTGPPPAPTPVPRSPVAGGARPPRTAPPTPKVRSIVAGESCPRTAVSGYYYRGWYRDWYARTRGGWTGDGCGGRVMSVPMSGDRNYDDPDNVVVWWFRVRTGASCAVAVFVPDTGEVLDAAGAPATYLVYATTDATGTPIGQLAVDQVHNQGRWVEAGRFRPPGGQLAVRLVTRGIDWGPGRAGAHLGVSAVRASC
jgi:hypothetical protein